MSRYKTRRLTPEEVEQRKATAPRTTVPSKARPDGRKDYEIPPTVPGPSKPERRIVDTRYDGMPESDELTPPPRPREKTAPLCMVCNGVLGDGPVEALPVGGVHIRCLDWTGKPFPHAAKLQALRDRWPTLTQAQRRAVLDPCQAWARLERAWPPKPLTGEAVESVVVAVGELDLVVADALQERRSAPVGG